tara:strand:+ start:324 stop:950 length:627 start_codon:yes stop_codon:yes gene_type:complete
MNKIFYLIFFSSLLFISSCSFNSKNIDKTILIIEKFNLNHFSKNGKKLYSLETPYSVFNQTDQSYLFNQTNIKFFEKEIVKYNVNSDSAKLLNNKFIELKGNVEINDFNNNQTIIKSNKLSWHIDQSEFILDGNVTLVNNIMNLNSSKAMLDNKTDIIVFYNPVKYYYKDEDNLKKYNISSENAYYNISTKDVTFESKNDKVKSKVVF